MPNREPMTSPHRQLSAVLLNALCFSLWMPSQTLAEEACHTTQLTHEGNQLSVKLTNHCTTQVSWGYSACTDQRHSLSNEHESLTPGGSLSINIPAPAQGAAKLYYRTCNGECKVYPPGCFTDAEAKQSAEKKKNDIGLFGLPAGITSDSPPTQMIIALPRLNLQPLSPRPEPMETSTYDKLTALAQPPAKPSTSGNLLQPKPVTSQQTRPASALPTLNTKPLPNPNGAKVAPLTILKPSIGVIPQPPSQAKNQSYKVAACVWVQMSKRDWFGNSTLIFNNSCPKAVEVGLRVCVAGEPDHQQVLSIAHGGSVKHKVAHKEDQQLKYAYHFCQSRGCAPKLPVACH